MFRRIKAILWGTKIPIVKIDATLKAMDVNGDGSISVSEFVTAVYDLIE